MKEQKNILIYGFLLFLLIVGAISVFYREARFIQSINSLSIPVFLFTIASLVAKSNSYVRKALFDKVSVQEKIDEKCDDLLQSATKNAEKSNHSNEDEQLLGITRNEAYKSKLYLNFLYKRFIIVGNISVAINIIAMLSFVFCLLSLIGVFSIDTSFPWINVFSLALVFFDFFVLDELLKKHVEKIFNKLQKLTDDGFEKALKESDK